MTALSHEQLSTALARFVTDLQEAADLPYTQLGPQAMEEGLEELHHRLLVTRSAETRVSALLGQLIRIEARLLKAKLDADGDLETANAETVSRPTFGHANFASAKERESNLVAATIQERRNVRQIEKMLIDITATLREARARHRDLEREVDVIRHRMRVVESDLRVARLD